MLYNPHPSSVPQSPTLPAFDLPSEASITPKTSYESTGEISTTSNGSRSRHILDNAPASPRTFANSPVRQPQSSNTSRAISPPHPRQKKNTVPAENSDIIATPNVPSAPAPGMYWSRASTYGRLPSKCLRAHTATIIGELMFIFGGCDIRNCFTTLYILDLDTLCWSKPRTYGDFPPPCRAHSSTLVERDTDGPGKKSSSIYVFGGGDGPNYSNTLYVLDTVLSETLIWTKPITYGAPPSPRRAHTTCYWQNKIYVFGGGDGIRALHDVHVLDLTNPTRLTWSELQTFGPQPLSRGYHTGNLVGDKYIIYGGSDGHECFSDVHILDLSNNHWYQVEVDRSIPRLSHTSTQIGSYLFICGGHDGSKYSSDVLLLNLVTMNWETRKIYGTIPPARGYHTVVLYDSRLILFGGYDGKVAFDDVYILELSACAYLPQITNFIIDV
ncbi:hypothetical protein INT43_009126 [Umbelopsis isabellina]|uniref:Galactose oxidase n=1 Tax=Mortierella isabellina TaxID=91625 RepID=A0A8H7PCP5_MORIS|nr:hypothetical protein INT43_009126 [Umbelopsis isabellina]